VLEVRFGKADVAAPAQTTAADGLGVRALDPGTGGVARPERLGFLVFARALQRFEVLARLQPDDARLALGPSAAWGSGSSGPESSFERDASAQQTETKKLL